MNNVDPTLPGYGSDSISTRIDSPRIRLLAAMEYDRPINHNITSALDLSQMQSAVHQFEYATLMWQVFGRELSRRQKPACHLTLRALQRTSTRCGPVQIAPAKTRIGFQVRMIFAAVNKLSDYGLDAHVVLARRLAGPRFSRIDTMTPKCFVHHFRVESLSELDDEVKSWLREAYQVGTQEHLSR